MRFRSPKEKLRVPSFMARKAKAVPPKKEELLWVVDANNKVIGKAPRSKVHVMNMMHRSVYVFIANAKGEVYMQRRGVQKAVFPGYWDAGCAGQVTAGETYKKSALRELGEELGLKSRLSHVYTLKASKETDWEHVGLFIGKHNGPVTIREPKTEIMEGKFEAPEKILSEVNAGKLRITPNFRALLLWLIENRNSLKLRGVL